MTNPYYNPSGTPATGATGSSAAMRAELASIATGFALLPTLSGNANKLVVVNSAGTGLTVTSGSFVLASGKTLTVNNTVTFAGTDSVTVTATATTTLPIATYAITFSGPTTARTITLRDAAIRMMAGPASAVSGHAVTFSGTDGMLTADSGVAMPSSGTALASATAPATNPATGTPSSSTYLRGDLTWAPPTTSGILWAAWPTPFV